MVKVIDNNLLAEFRLMRNCAWCKKKVEECDPHHIFSRGAGRVDIRENLINLCRSCHNSNHDGHSPMRAELLILVAKREGTSAEKIVDKIMHIRWDQSEKVKEIS